MESPGSVTREHGNSFLAILNWVGILGVIPFAFLLVLIAVCIARAFLWLRRTQDARLYCVPLAMIVAAGLVDVAFEDWLFAVGYYLSVFFWIAAFALVDFLHTEDAFGNVSSNLAPDSLAPLQQA